MGTNGATAILGAGWLGAAIANACPPPVIATTRSGQRPPLLDASISVTALDVLAAMPAIAPIAAAHTWIFAIAPGADQDRRALYVDGPARLLASLPDTSVRRVVWIGSTSALPDLDALLDETCETWPDDPRGRIQREAEAVVRDACTRHGIPWIVLRMGGLHGPGRELGRIFGRADPTADGSRATNLVHRDDAVAAALAAVATDACGIVHVVDDDHCARAVMVDAARAAAGLPPPEWAGRSERTHGKRVANDRLRAWLGVTLQHPRHSPLATPDRHA